MKSNSIISCIFITFAVLALVSVFKFRSNKQIILISDSQSSVWKQGHDADDSFLSGQTPSSVRSSKHFSGKLSLKELKSITGLNFDSSLANTDPGTQWVHKFILDGSPGDKSVKEKDVSPSSPAEPDMKIYTDPDQHESVRVGKWTVISRSSVYPQPAARPKPVQSCGPGSFCQLVASLDRIHLPGATSPGDRGWKPNAAAAETAHDQASSRYASWVETYTQRALMEKQKKKQSSAARSQSDFPVVNAKPEEVALNEKERAAAEKAAMRRSRASSSSLCSSCLSSTLAQAGPARWMVGRWIERDAMRGGCADLCS